MAGRVGEGSSKDYAVHLIPVEYALNYALREYNTDTPRRKAKKEGSDSQKRGLRSC